MRFISLTILVGLGIQAPIATAQLVVPNIFSSPERPRPAQQNPMDALAKIFPGSSDSNKASQSSSDGLSVSDVLGKEGRINIFAGFTRDIDDVSKRLDDNSKDTIVLAPLNSAITQLPRKPWEDPQEYETFGAQAYDGSGGESRAYKNLKRFVEAHILPVSEWEEQKKVQTVGGNTLWWEGKNGKKMVCSNHWNLSTSAGRADSEEIQPGNIEVSNVADKVSHGEVWVIKDCLNYKE